MKILQTIRSMKEDSVRYLPEVREYVCTVQQTFSLAMALFFLLHLVVIDILDYSDCKMLDAARWLSLVQMACSILWYVLFKYYIKSRPTHIVGTALCNVLQLLMLLELHYLLYNEYISYTVLVCIILCTSLTIIGYVRFYTVMISTALLLDCVITAMNNVEMLHTRTMKLYFIDNLFILVIAVTINICFTRLKFQEFEKQKQILFLSERDGLTGLLNRKALEACMEKLTREKMMCAMILLDLDNFKKLNDTLGHYAGDRCLCTVSSELQSMFRSTDYVCRLGGDEFVVVMPDIPGPDCVLERARMILERVPHEYPSESGSIRITCSIGIAFSQSDAPNLYKSLYQAADCAMYASKSKGKNSVTIYSEELAAVR